MANSIEHSHLAEHQQGAQHKDGPALKLVQETLRHGDPPMLHHHTNRADSETVHEYGDGNAGQK